MSGALSTHATSQTATCVPMNRASVAPHGGRTEYLVIIIVVSELNIQLVNGCPREVVGCICAFIFFI